MIIFSVNDLNHSDHNFANILKNSLPCSSYNITDINEILKKFGMIDNMFNTIGRNEVYGNLHHK